MKVQLPFLIIYFLFSFNSAPPKYIIKDILVSDRIIEYNVDCNKPFYNGMKTQAISKGLVLFEKELLVNQGDEKISFDISKLPIQLLTKITRLLVLNDSIKIEIRIIDNESCILSSKEVYFLSPKSKLLTKIELATNDSFFSIRKKNLQDEDYNSMFLDYYRFNKIFLNRITGFNPKFRIETSKENLTFVIYLPYKFAIDYNFCLEDTNKKKFKLIQQDLREECHLIYRMLLTIPEDVPLNGVLHLVIEDLETKILYTVPIT
ncbi:MAG: hypothetical protein ACOVP1_14405 [Bacteroidia bacterium]